MSYTFRTKDMSWFWGVSLVVVVGMAAALPFLLEWYDLVFLLIIMGVTAGVTIVLMHLLTIGEAVIVLEEDRLRYSWNKRPKICSQPDTEVRYAKILRHKFSPFAIPRMKLSSRSKVQLKFSPLFQGKGGRDEFMWFLQDFRSKRQSFRDQGK